jgi:curved DNA-binding protein
VKKDYYDILGVSRKGSAEDIQRAYRKGARRCHPDVNKETDAEERFKQLNEAYSVLSDPDKRKLYDRWGKDWQQAERYEKEGVHRPFADRYRYGGDDNGSNHDWQQGGPFSNHGYGSSDAPGYEDILRDIFGAEIDTIGAPVHADLALSLDELFNRRAKTISFVIESLDNQGNLQRQNKTIEVKIPPGVSHGSTIRLKGQGGPGRLGRPAGDLLLKIKLNPDSRFMVDGYDLRSEIAITPWEAALGTTVEVNTPDGLVRLKIPPGSQSGRQFRLKGKGLYKKEGRGDLLAGIKIVIPEPLSEAERELFEELSRKSLFDPRRQEREAEFEKAA